MSENYPRPVVFEALKKSNLLGVSIDHDTKIAPRRNFAVVSPASPIGSKIFIHGRELFPTREAAKKFFDEESGEKFPYEEFGEAAKQKIRMALSPQALEGRIGDCHDFQSTTQYTRHAARLHKKKNPQIKGIPHHRSINSANAYSSSGAIASALDRNGIDIDHGTLFTEEDISNLYNMRRNYCKEKLAAARKELSERKMPQHLLDMMGEVEKAVMENSWDPEIIKNFMKGASICKDSPDISLADVIERGVEARTEKILRNAARQMTDPYDYIFLEPEAAALRNTASQIDPKLLMNALNNNCAIIVSDAGNLRDFSNILGYQPDDWKAAKGVCHKTHRDQNYFNTIVIVTDNGKSWITTHELEHARDLRVPGKEFVSRYSREYIKSCIEKDGNHISAAKKRASSINPFNCSQNDAQWLIDMARRMEYLLTESPGGYELTNVAGSVFLALCEAEAHIKRFGNEGMSSYYPNSSSRHTEIPAVMEQFSHCYGKEMAKFVFPNLFNAHESHRLTDETLNKGFSR